MTNRLRPWGIAAVFLFGCATGGVSAQLATSSASGQDAPIVAPNGNRWEYKCMQFKFTGKMAREANRLGKEGWEMAGENDSAWCFKRPLP